MATEKSKMVRTRTGSKRSGRPSEPGEQPSRVAAKQIERVPIDELTSDSENVRQHSDRNLEAIKASLTKFGQQTPIVVDHRGVVIAGNARLTAAKQLGWDSIDIIRTTLTGAEATAYAIADNRTAELAQWDHALLVDSLQDLDAEIQAATGFTADEIASMVFTETVVPEQDKSSHDAYKYESRVLKQIVLIYGLEQYERVFDAMAEYAEKHGLSDNSEVVVHLLEQNGHAVSTRG